VIARLVGKNTLIVESRLILTVTDAVDLVDGDLGADIERVFTVPLRFLEQNGWAYAVPFQVVLHDKSGKPAERTLPFDDDEGKTIARPASSDPNDIIGPAGVGALNHVDGADVMPYTIHFENAAGLATAPAAMVSITQTLDPDLDWTTFRLGDFGFGNTVIDVPADSAFFQTRLDLTATRGVYLDVTAGINAATGEVRWEFTAIDPATSDLPEDPLVGFLPPNVNGPEGEGFVTYTVQPKSSAKTGDRIDAQASIVFDVNDPIVTPAIFNTLDRGAPGSTVLPLPATENTLSFPVTWSGADDVGGSGIAGYDVYVSDNGGTYSLWQSATPATQAIFSGLNGHTYAFYSIARDNAGNSEAAPTAPDTQVTVLFDSWQGTPGDDRLTLRLDSTGKYAEFFENVDTNQQPARRIRTEYLGDLTVSGLDGNDVLVIDMSNGDPVPAGGMLFDGGPGSNTLKIMGTDAADALTVTDALMPLGAKAISGMNTDVVLDTLVGGTIELASLAISGNVKVSAPNGNKVLRIGSLSIVDGGMLDLADNDLIVQATPDTREDVLDQISRYVRSARGTGTNLWQGNGLTSSAAATYPNGLTGLAVVLNQRVGSDQPLFGEFGGLSVNLDSILVKYTWNGDVNLDGAINLNDYFIIDSGYLAGASGYANGDVNYDGVIGSGSGAINLNDYFLIDSAYLGQAAPLAAKLSSTTGQHASKVRKAVKRVFSENKIQRSRSQRARHHRQVRG
jgi:hypothetical protein